MSAMIAGAAGSAAIGGIASYLAQMSAMDRMGALQDKALQQFLSISIPDPKLQELALQRFVQEGTLTPEFEQAIRQAPSEFNKIIVNQGQKTAQNRALAELENIGYTGGLRLQDKAALQDAMLEGQVRDRGNRQAIMDDMNRRGQGGSGFALQAQLQGQQASGDRDARSALSAAAQAQDRALQAIIGAGDLSTKYRSQDFQEQAQRAQANDAINRFNAQNMQNVQHSNVGLQNRANEMNLAEKQRISDGNVNVSNEEQKHNKALIQKQFENQMRMAEAKSGLMNGQAQLQGQRGQANANLFSNIGNAGSQAFTAYGANQAQEERADKDRDFYAQWFNNNGIKR